MPKSEITDATGYLTVRLRVTRHFSPMRECRGSQFLATGRHVVRYKRATRYVLLIALALLAPSLLTNLVPRAHAVTYSLGTIPFLTQEGSTITLIFSVSGATENTLYQFRF